MNMVQNSSEEFSAKMFAEGLISDAVRRNQSYNTIITDFYSKLTFLKTIPEVVQCCKQFFTVFLSLGEPYVTAGNTLKQDIVSTISEECGLCLKFD